MEYTQEMFEEDEKICLWVFANRIDKDKILTEFKDDFISYALSKMPNIRANYKDCGYTYGTYAFRSVYFNMLRYYNLNIKKHLGKTISIDENVGNCEDLTFIDTLAGPDNLDDNINYETLKKYIEEAKQKCMLTKFGKQRKIKNFDKIIDLYIKGYNMSDIGRKFDISRERVRQYVDMFCDNLQRILIDKGYCLNKEFTKELPEEKKVLKANVIKIKTLLKKHKIKQKDLAKLLNNNISMITRYFDGTFNLSLDKLKIIADLLKVEITDIVEIV